MYITYDKNKQQEREREKEYSLTVKMHYKNQYVYEILPMLEISDHVSTISYGGGSIESKISILPIVHVVLRIYERFMSNKTDHTGKIARPLKKTSERLQCYCGKISNLPSWLAKSTHWLDNDSKFISQLRASLKFISPTDSKLRQVKPRLPWAYVINSYLNY